MDRFQSHAADFFFLRSRLASTVIQKVDLVGFIFICNLAEVFYHVNNTIKGLSTNTDIVLKGRNVSGA